MGAGVPQIIIGRATVRVGAGLIVQPSRGSDPGGSAVGRADAHDSGQRDGVRIRPAQAQDLDRIVQVDALCFSSPWSFGAFESLVGRPRVHLLVAEVTRRSRGHRGESGRSASAVVGHAVVWWAADEAELATLAVDPAFRRRGIGSALLDSLMREISTEGVRSVFLEVRASNAAARALYLGRGFREVGVRRHYYDHPKEDAQILQRRLWHDI